jgi:xanthine/CO dehydrogenase XdhC/CoxF family maturation factor
MKELKRIVEVYSNIDFSQRKAALATVVKLYGSSYRRPGARMLITDDGRWEGAISGGCLEGDALRKARQVISSGKPMVVTYDTLDDSTDSLGVGLGCNGIIDVLIEPITPEHISSPIHLFKAFTETNQNQVAVLATVFVAEGETGLHVGDRYQLQANGQVLANKTDISIPDFLMKDIHKVYQAGKSETKLYLTATGKAEIFMEILQPSIQLVIFGGGYDAIPLVKLARDMGWHVTVSDDCIAHLTPIRFPSANAIVHARREEIGLHIPLISLRQQSYYHIIINTTWLYSSN